jgi:hypothetical protein
VTETKGPTRAELLEECKAAGLKATGWKKERMAAELAKLGGRKQEPPGEAEAPAPDAAGDDEGQGERETTAAENPDPSPRLTGWCSRTPMWSYHHLNCPARKGKASCGCECHEPGWTQPPIPEGARLSKGNPAYKEPNL